MEENKALPEALRDPSLRKDLAYDEALIEQQDAEDVEAIDDEYWDLGTREPRILITTSRDPSAKLKQFAKELKLIIPNATRVNRGNINVKDLPAAAISNGLTDLIIVHEHKGTPSGMIISHLPHGPTAYFTLSQVVLRHDVTSYSIPTSYPHLIFDNLSDDNKVAKRVKRILQALFPPPAYNSKTTRVMTFANSNDHISFRHHLYIQDKSIPGVNGIRLSEAGPRFEMRLYLIKRGTFDDKSAEDEWSLKLYQRRTKNALG